VETKPGRSCILEGVADELHELGGTTEWRLQPWDKRVYFQWERPKGYCCNVPSTKISTCLEKYFPEVNPEAELYKYEIVISQEAREIAQRYIDTLPTPYGIIHPWGTSQKPRKDLTRYEVAVLCDLLEADGLTPVVLSWEWPLIDWMDNERVFCPDRTHWLWQEVTGKITGNAQVIAALIDGAEVFYGIDSGPAHLAACKPITTPVFVLWWEFHPATNFDLDHGNVTHFVRDDYHEALPLSVRQYVENAYTIRCYEGDLTDWLLSVYEVATST